MQRLGYELENLTLNKRPWELIRDARQEILNLTAQLVAGEARAAALQADMVALAKLATQREAERDKWLNAFNQSEQFQSGPIRRAEAAIVSLQATTDGLVKLATDSAEKWEQRAHASANQLATLQAQLQAITKEMRDDGDSSLKYWMSKLDMAAGKL